MSALSKGLVEGPACGLCHDVVKLHKSHIVPEFAYKAIYDADHKILSFDPTSPWKTWKQQKGLRERLLCRNCEQLLNNEYEKPFKVLWYDENLLHPLEKGIVSTLTVPDYARFKLFHLSVLLRADLARHPQWREVDLGKSHRSRIRELVLSGDPGRPEEYPVICSAIQREPDSPAIWWDLVAHPSAGRMDGARFYLFTFGGCGWLYVVASHNLKIADEVCLRPDGSLPVRKGEWLAFQRYRRYFSSIQEGGVRISR